jgi:hypothetical protein
LRWLAYFPAKQSVVPSFSKTPKESLKSHRVTLWMLGNEQSLDQIRNRTMMLRNEFNFNKPRIAIPSSFGKRAQKQHMQFVLKVATPRATFINVF